MPSLGRILLIALLLSCTAAEAQQVGDLGRAPPGAEANGKSSKTDFNLTDQEVEMRNRVWRFLVAPHAEGWFHDLRVELQRAHFDGASDRSRKIDRYYRWLQRADYRSSRVRYRTVADDVTADLDTLPDTFRSICAVIEVDRQREVASDAFDGLEAGDVLAITAENDAHIALFVRAVIYRYDAYSYALNHLLVETPHEEAVEVDGLLSELAIYVDRAGAQDFCSGASVLSFGDGNGSVPSRVLLAPPSEGEYLK